MPLLRHAKKALRASFRKAEQNQRSKSRAKTMMDKTRKEPTAENLASSYSAIDRATKTKVFHPNKAARLKSQLARLVK